MSDLQKAPAPTRGLMVKTFRGNTIKAMACLLLIIAIAILANAAFFGFFGGVQGWESWRADHSWQLLAWRLTLYAGLVIAWSKLNKRFPEKATELRRKRKRRVEILFALLVMLMEFSKFALRPGDLQ